MGQSNSARVEQSVRQEVAPTPCNQCGSRAAARRKQRSSPASAVPSSSDSSAPVPVPASASPSDSSASVPVPASTDPTSEFKVAHNLSPMSDGYVLLSVVTIYIGVDSFRVQTESKESHITVSQPSLTNPKVWYIRQRFPLDHHSTQLRYQTATGWYEETLNW